MTERDSGRLPAEGGATIPPPAIRQPAIILVEPQLGENIGAAARAMLNCGLTDLRLVCPREGWPSEKARASASGADPVLDSVRLFASVEEAISGLCHVYATTARSRDMVKRVVTPRQAAAELRVLTGAGQACGILFGPERMGLVNDHVALAGTIVSVPLNPDFTSLNLAQAVLLLGYEWYTAGDSTPPVETPTGDSAPAPAEQLDYFFRHLEAELDRSGFLRNVEKRPRMMRNIRNLFLRTGLTEQEVRTLHGILESLAHPQGGRSG